MGKYTIEELEEALRVVSSTISKCEKAQQKFTEGTSQHTLLKNRIKAMYISKSFIGNENNMNKYTKEELAEALKVVSSTINKCEKMQLKFAEGTSHHTLLKNRLKAMYISQSLITYENTMGKYTKEELIESLRPVSSIISKCEKAQVKFVEGTSHYTRFNNIIKAMYISKSLITDEISKRD